MALSRFALPPDGVGGVVGIMILPVEASISIFNGKVIPNSLRIFSFCAVVVALAELASTKRASFIASVALVTASFMAAGNDVSDSRASMADFTAAIWSVVGGWGGVLPNLLSKSLMVIVRSACNATILALSSLAPILATDAWLATALMGTMACLLPSKSMLS